MRSTWSRSEAVRATNLKIAAPVTTSARSTSYFRRLSSLSPACASFGETLKRATRISVCVVGSWVPLVSISIFRPCATSSSRSGIQPLCSWCSRGSPPVITPSSGLPLILRMIRATCIRLPSARRSNLLPSQVYGVSHHLQVRLQPISLMNTALRPVLGPSPWKVGPNTSLTISDFSGIMRRRPRCSVDVGLLHIAADDRRSRCARDCGEYLLSLEADLGCDLFNRWPVGELIHLAAVAAQDRQQRIIEAEHCTVIEVGVDPLAQGLLERSELN